MSTTTIPAPPAPEPRYPVWLGATSFGWAVLGWVLAVSAPRLAFVPGIEILHLLLPGVTVLLILGNLAFSLYAFFVRKVGIDRLLLVTGLQVGLFTTLFFQFAAHVGAECYWIQRPTQSSEWVQFSVAHAVRASDVLDSVEAFGWNLQVIRHRGAFVGAFVVAYHVVVDLFMLGLLWALLDRIKKRLLEHPARARKIRNFGIFLFVVWLAAWLYCLWLRPWRPIDVPLWLGENVLRVLDFTDAMDAFDIHWHQVPRELPESTLTIFYRLWIATGISLLLQWRIARNKVRPLPVPPNLPQAGRLLWLGSAAVLLAALIGADLLVGSAQAGRITELTAVASAADEDRAQLALAAIRRLGPNAPSAIEPLAEAQSRLPERSDKIIETLGYLGPSAIGRLRAIALNATTPAVEFVAVAGLQQIGPRAAPALAAVWSATKAEDVKAAAAAGLHDFGLMAMPYLLETTNQANSAAHFHWFNELDRNWTLRMSSNRTVHALQKLQGTNEWRDHSALFKDKGWVVDSGSAAIPFLTNALANKETRFFALEVMAEIGPHAKEAVPALFEALAQEDEAFRDAGAAALDKIDAKWYESEQARQTVPALVERRVGYATYQLLEKLQALMNAKDKEAVPALVKALANKDARVRIVVAERLGKFGPSAKEAVAALVKALEDKDPNVRAAAAGALGQIGPQAKEAVPALVKLLVDNDSAVRGVAVHVLYHEIDSKWPESDQARQVVPVLVQALAHSASDVRKATAQTLGWFGPHAKEAVPELVRALADNDPPVRLVAVKALGQIGPHARDSVPALIKALAVRDGVLKAAAATLDKIDVKWHESDQARQVVPALVQTVAHFDRDVRMAAIRTLDKIDAKWYASAQALQVVPALLMSLVSTDVAVRMDALHALDRIDPKWRDSARARQVVSVLADSLAASNARACEVAAWALGQIGPSAREAVPALVKALEVGDLYVQKAAVEALGQIGPGAKEAVPALAKFLDRDWIFRANAAAALGKIGPHAEAAVPALVRILADHDSLVRRVAVEALRQIGPGAKEAVPALVKFLVAKEESVRAAAATALERIDAKWFELASARQDLSALVHALVASEGPVRAAAATALNRIDAKWHESASARQALPKLVRMLVAKDEPVRAAAATALAKIDAKWHESASARQAVPDLVKGLAGPLEVRTAAVAALGQIGPNAKEAVPALIHALATNDFFVHISIATALGKIGPQAKEAVPSLVKLLVDGNGFVQNAAARALGNIGPSARDALPALEKLAKDDRPGPAQQAARKAIVQIRQGAK